MKLYVCRIRKVYWELINDARCAEGADSRTRRPNHEYCGAKPSCGINQEAVGKPPTLEEDDLFRGVSNMSTATPVVTAARLKQGLTWDDFLAGITVNRDKFEQNYTNPVLTEDDLPFFRKASALAEGPRKLLAIAEAWCGDVYREPPRSRRLLSGARARKLRLCLDDCSFF